MVASPTEEKPRRVGAELLLVEGGSRRIPLSELERLEEEGDQETLERVVVEFSDGTRIRPYRFASVGPVEMVGDTIIL
jgi:hypothetical protein